MLAGGLPGDLEPISSPHLSAPSVGSLYELAVLHRHPFHQPGMFEAQAECYVRSKSCS